MKYLHEHFRFSIITATFVGLCACSTLQPHSSYKPDELWQLTSCDKPLILRHKTKGEISVSDKLERLRFVGLSLYGGTSDGESLSGKAITYTDKFLAVETCEDQLVKVHYTTGFEDFEHYAAAKRTIRPVYVKHMKSRDINRNPDISCTGVFEYQKMLTGSLAFNPIYNEELCWERLKG